MGTRNMPQERQVWLDSLRGLTVLMVLMHHTQQSASSWTELPGIVYWADWLGSYFRMPAFLFCSGLLFGRTITRPWPVVLEKRGLFAVWIIFFWSLLAYSAEWAGLRLHPWNDWTFDGSVRPFYEIFFPPYGILWFVYAILFMAIYARAISRLQLLLQALITIAATLAVRQLSSHVEADSSLGHLVMNMHTRALPYFMFGVWLGGPMMHYFQRPSRAILPFILGAITTVVINRARDTGLIENELIFSLALTVTFVSGVRLISTVPFIESRLAVVGRSSLQVFLLHEYFVAASTTITFTLLPPFSATVQYTVITLAAIILTLGTALALKRYGPYWLFAAPRPLANRIFHSEWNSVPEPPEAREHRAGTMPPSDL